MNTESSKAILSSYRAMAHVGVQIDAMVDHFGRSLRRHLGPTHGFRDIVNGKSDNEDDPSGTVHRLLVSNYNIWIRADGQRGKPTKLPQITFALQTCLAPSEPSFDKDFHPYVALLCSDGSLGPWVVGDFEKEWFFPGVTPCGSWHCRERSGDDNYFECHVVDLTSIDSAAHVDILADIAARMITHTFGTVRGLHSDQESITPDPNSSSGWTDL